MRSRLCFPIVLLGWVICTAGAAVNFTQDEFTVVSSAASPEVSWAIKMEGANLVAAFEVEPWTPDGPEPQVEAGLSAAQRSTGPAKLRRRDPGGGRCRYELAVPARSIVAQQADWGKLRFAFAVTWPGGPNGVSRQRERFLHGSARAPHAGLAADPAEWQPLDLRQHFSEIADRKNTLTLSFAQPIDGKASIVLEDSAGRRVRNLVSGQTFAKGSHPVEWDGLDDRGAIVGPGQYRWRAISHPGVRPEYLFSFANDGSPPWRTGTGKDMWGPDHSTITAAAAGEDWTFFGGRVAESGYAIVAVDQAGVKQQHYVPPSGTGLAAVELAVAGDTLYAAHDGLAWGEKIDRTKPNWKATYKLTLSRFAIASGKVREFPNKNNFVLVSSTEVGPGSAGKKSDEAGLVGMAALGGKVYIANRATNSVFVLDGATGAKVSEIPLTSPGPLAAKGGTLYAATGQSLVRLDAASGKAAPVRLEKLVAKISGLAVDPAGRLFIADAAVNVVHVFTSAGKFMRTLGEPRPTAEYTGAYRADWFVKPCALAVAANGWLWVTEDRWHPKRLSAWDTGSWQMQKEKFGPTHYGAPGASFDPEDATRWIGQNTLWQLDLSAKSAKPVAVLEPDAHHDPMLHHSFRRIGGGTMVISYGKITRLSELEAGGRLRPLAAVSSCHQFSYAYRWHPPQAFISAFQKAVPAPPKPSGGREPYADSHIGVMWVDENGDGEMQAEEFNFATTSEGFAGSGWGIDLHDFTIRALATVKGHRVLMTLAPDVSWAPGQRLKYATLDAALARAVPVDVAHHRVETAVDRFGNVVCNSEPEMKSFAPDGKLRWSYPNRWVGVHGSHDAPLPETGVLQGALFFLGHAPLDQTSDVFVMNGNHGRFFALTSDGIYLDEFFKDVRMGGSVDAEYIGGECFGGFFGRSEKDGHYYLQSGHTDYRIFRLHGLDGIQRSTGVIQVTRAHLTSAAKRLERKQQAGATASAREATVAALRTPPTIDGKNNDWPAAAPIRWEKNGKFPVEVQAGFDPQHLYLFYTVRDESPWLNTGKDATLLFKTGDSIDLQLGTDAGAEANRSNPVPGDVRLLIGPFQGKPIAVLYRHRLKSLAGAQSVNFSSPWRSEKVDDVRAVGEARIAVQTEASAYRVEVAIPLSALGLASPAGKTFRGDFGVLHSDPGGTMTQLRHYWSNQATNLVNDVPGEIMLTPNRWGTVKFEGVRP